MKSAVRIIKSLNRHRKLLDSHIQYLTSRIDKAEHSKEVNDFILNLDTKQSAIINEYCTFAEIGDFLDVSLARARQIHDGLRG